MCLCPWQTVTLFKEIQLLRQLLTIDATAFVIQFIHYVFMVVYATAITCPIKIRLFSQWQNIDHFHLRSSFVYRIFQWQSSGSRLHRAAPATAIQNGRKHVTDDDYFLCSIVSLGYLDANFHTQQTA